MLTKLVYYEQPKLSLSQDGIRGLNHFAFMWIVSIFVQLFSFMWGRHNCTRKMAFVVFVIVLWESNV